MLKRLELVGFKSFADKTQFDFPPGLTGIVGPNGSGKSNVVDAVRWVLGEQSARSLRGGEMTDVIFNGSAHRRGLGLAEVTMTFDNARRSLAADAEEVQITRRVYRSGEGEYLINRQVCRLKDIKDLFLGSGAGTDAYSIIEQGRVDVLLQASTKERRTIFEEAAGISRYKVRKVEALRKLERVDQNLARLRDILDEVEKQLRSVRLQASKAQQYQQHSGRLRALRVAIGLKEFHDLTARLDADAAVLERQRAELDAEIAQADAWERELHELEGVLGRIESDVRAAEADLALAREQIVAEEGTQSHERALAEEVEAEASRLRRRLVEALRDLAHLERVTSAAAAERERAEERCVEQRKGVEHVRERLAAVEERQALLQEQLAREQEERMDRMREAARLQNDAVSYRAQVDNLSRERDRLRARSEQAAGHLATLDLELQELTAADDALQARQADARQALVDARAERERLRRLAEETARRAADLRERRSGLVSRVEVLEGLERSHEGVGTGGREVFAHLESADPGPWRTVLGLVADFLSVRREFAPLIDLALGERAQRFVVADLALLTQALRQRPAPLSGRVSFLPLAALPAGGPAALTDHLPAPAEGTLPSGGLVALAERVVRCEDARLAGLPRHLLGRTLIVRDLAAARALAERQPGLRCVTLQGELLEPDGTVTVGTHHAETGILSRKSELRDLREQVSVLDLRLGELERDLVDLRERVGQLDGQCDRRQRDLDVLAEQVADLRSRIGQHRQRREGLSEEVEISRSEMSGLEQEIESLTASWRRAQDQAAEAEGRVQTLQTRLEEADRELRRREGERQRWQQEVVSGQVALAQAEERLSGLRAEQERLEGERGRRQRERDQAEAQLGATRQRLDEGQRKLLAATAALADWYARKEGAERRLAEWAGERDRLRQERQGRAERVQASRASWRGRQEEVHQRELAVNELRHRRDGLCARLQEDYQLDLAAAYREAVADGAVPAGPTGDDGTPLAPEAANDEINDLKRKLARLGSVNLEAIEELGELEARANTLQVQYDDIDASGKILQDIISRINVDSRRLFAETFTTVRGHFQELFRKLFGGGMADVVLEDESDVLESGIEVVARPPGKELRSISLMSGGEKTLTAVALLLAIFRSKPSPFCILDEVDAALDEANVGRFTAVLREFLDQSQFILITHSKRTMACCDLLYGVTMQESGISTRMAVRFQDWPGDEGSPAA